MPTGSRAWCWCMCLGMALMLSGVVIGGVYLYHYYVTEVSVPALTGLVSLLGYHGNRSCFWCDWL